MGNANLISLSNPCMYKDKKSFLGPMKMQQYNVTQYYWKQHCTFPTFPSHINSHNADWDYHPNKSLSIPNSIYRVYMLHYVNQPERQCDHDHSMISDTCKNKLLPCSDMFSHGEHFLSESILCQVLYTFEFQRSPFFPRKSFVVLGKLVSFRLALLTQ